MDLRFGRGGWVEVDDIAECKERRLYVRFRVGENGRLGVSELYLDGGNEAEPIPAKLLRLMPLEAIEALANSRASRIIAEMDQPSIDLSRLATHYHRGWKSVVIPDDPRELHWIAESHLAQQSGSGVNQAPAAPRARKLRLGGRPASLTLALDGKLSDEFLSRVAESYNWLVRNGENPAPILAKEANVSPKTVHGWVALARTRGLLAPGRQGRKG